MMNEKKNAHQRGLKILGVISVTFFLFAFSLTAFSQDSTPSESKVELADGKIRIVYAFDAPVVASTSQMDDTLLAKTHKIIFDEENSWAQTYSVESIQAAENLLGIDFLISRNIEKYAFNPNKKDTLWCCTIKVDIENSKGQYIEKDKQEATKDGSESTKIQHGI